MASFFLIVFVSIVLFTNQSTDVPTKDNIDKSVKYEAEQEGNFEYRK